MTGNHHAAMLTALAEARIRFVVAGGVAIVMPGVERMTMGIDLALDFEPSNVARFITEMKRMHAAARPRSSRRS